MNSIQEQGYYDTLTKLGFDLEKEAFLGRAAMAIGRGAGKVKGLLGRGGGAAFPTAGKAQQAASKLRAPASKVHPSEMGNALGWGGKQAPSVPAASNIAKFEQRIGAGGAPRKFVSRPPTTPAAAAQPQPLRGPEVMPRGQVATAPPAAAVRAPAAAPAAGNPAVQMNTPGATPLKYTTSPTAKDMAKLEGGAGGANPATGLLAKGKRWALPAAAVGGGAYVMWPGGSGAGAGMPQQYYGGYPG